jgi:hypothetical protein
MRERSYERFIVKRFLQHERQQPSGRFRDNSLSFSILCFAGQKLESRSCYKNSSVYQREALDDVPQPLKRSPIRLWSNIKALLSLEGMSLMLSHESSRNHLSSLRRAAVRIEKGDDWCSLCRSFSKDYERLLDDYNNSLLTAQCTSQRVFLDIKLSSL